MLNKWASHIISNLRVLHRHALVSKTLPQYLKIVLEHVTELEMARAANGPVFGRAAKVEQVGC